MTRGATALAMVALSCRPAVDWEVEQMCEDRRHRVVVWFVLNDN